MAGKFESYPDYVGTVTNLEHESSGSEQCSFYSRKEEQCLKKLVKLAKKRNKLLRRAVKQQEMEKLRVEEEESGSARKTFKEIGKSFCKAVCKALPVLLTSLAGRIINWIFKGKSDKKGLRFA